MNKCPNCHSTFYVKLKTGKQECQKCGQVYGKETVIESVPVKDILLG